MKERIGLTPQLPARSSKSRFAGDALQGVREQPLEVTFGSKKDLNNPQIGLVKNPAQIRNNITPGGDFESTRTEKMFE